MTDTLLNPERMKGSIVQRWVDVATKPKCSTTTTAARYTRINNLLAIAPAVQCHQWVCSTHSQAASSTTTTVVTPAMCWPGQTNTTIVGGCHLNLPPFHTAPGAVWNGSYAERGPFCISPVSRCPRLAPPASTLPPFHTFKSQKHPRPGPFSGAVFQP